MTTPSPLTVLWFGTGSMTAELLPAVNREKLNILAFIDERPERQSTTFMGAPVIGFNAVSCHTFDYILVGARPTDVISARLRDAGITDSKIISVDFENLLQAGKRAAYRTVHAGVQACLRDCSGLAEVFDPACLSASSWLKRIFAEQAREPAFTLPAGDEGDLLSHLASWPDMPAPGTVIDSIHIETTNNCAYRCCCCSVWNTRRPKGVISEDSINILTGRLPDFQGEVALNYCGEPLLDKALPKKIKLLRNAWPEATLCFVSTLGQPVGESFLDALWENGLNRLDVSFYGYTPKLYEKIHGVSRFDLASGNLRHVLQSRLRRRFDGHVRIRRLHVEEGLECNAPFDNAGRAETAAAFLESVSLYPGVSVMETYLMSQAGRAPVRRKRGTTLPCSIAWGEYSRALFVTWQLDVALCCATTGDEILFGNLRGKTLQDIFAGETYRKFIQAVREDRLDDYPFCKQCERHIGGTTEELLRIASWKIAAMLRAERNGKTAFCITGEPRLAAPLEEFYRRHFSEYLPLEQLGETRRNDEQIFIFVVAQGKTQLIYCKDMQARQANTAGQKVRVLPVLGVGFPQPQTVFSEIENLYAPETGFTAQEEIVSS